MPYHIHGGNPLCGTVRIQGSKNGALPLFAAALLVRGKTILHNCPKITDIAAMQCLLEKIGCQFQWEGSTVCIDASHVFDGGCPREQVKAMRSSVMLLGPMLARCGHLCMELPGGCAIGKRPIDIHIAALQTMNAHFCVTDEWFEAVTEGLTGSLISLPFPSVGATENIIMAAVLADGVTYLANAAKEPEITQLCDFFVKAGASIDGIGTDRLTITGMGKNGQLAQLEYTIMPDRIVAGTYLFAAIATRGRIILEEVPVSQLTSVLSVIRQMGAKVKVEQNQISIDARWANKPVDFIQTKVYPGFPTDLQSMLTVCLAKACGVSLVRETIFENRFQIVKSLEKMGACIIDQKQEVLICGVQNLMPAELVATELRGGAALTIAALAARGESILKGTTYIDRGYENIVRDLSLLGAEIDVD